VLEPERVSSEAEDKAYALFFDGSPRPMYVFDLATLAFLDVNEAALELYGYGREEFLGMTLLDIRPPEEIPSLLAYLKEAPDFDHVWRHRRKDGSEMLVEAGWSRFEMEGHQAQMVILTDVTAREHALSRLASSEAAFRAAVDVVVDGFMVLSAVRDPNGRLTDLRFEYANDTACQLLGSARDRLIGASTAVALAPERALDMLRRYAPVVELGTPFADDAVAVERTLADGRVAAGLYDVRAAKLEDGLAVTFRDVTEARRADAVLRENEERFRTVFESCPMGIAIVDRDGRFTDANPAFGALLGYDLDSLKQMTFMDITHPDDVARDAELAAQLFGGEIPSYALEKRYRTSRGETVWVNLTATALRDDAGSCTARLGIVEDITARKRMQGERLEAAAAAARTLGELTPREREVLNLAHVSGMTTRQLGQQLHVSARTAESHMASVYRKLHVTSRDAALTEYRRLLAASLGAMSPSTPPRVRSESP
jgi:PAS domain S-box-containing protein